MARMGNDNLVLGLEWMKIFNPIIDWKKRTLSLNKEILPIFEESTLRRKKDNHVNLDKKLFKETRTTVTHNLFSTINRTLLPGQSEVIPIQTQERLRGKIGRVGIHPEFIKREGRIKEGEVIIKKG